MYMYQQAMESECLFPINSVTAGLEINDGHDGQCRRCPFTGRGAPQKISVFTASFALP